MNDYSENLNQVNQLVTRNQDAIQEVKASAFWLSDEKQADGSNKIEVKFSSVRQWLKVSQTQNNTCHVIPIDGNRGVFRESGLPISQPDKFAYQWSTENGIDEKNPGDCDCLLLNEKWHFLEFKAEASSRELKQIENNRNKAEAQLAKSMVSFREQLGKPTLACLCVVITPEFYDYPKSRASLQTRKVRFLKLYSCKLEEITVGGNTSYNLDL